LILKKHGVKDKDVLAAALLHDVIEDCDTDHNKIYKKFGGFVLYIVFECTNHFTIEYYPDKPRFWRKMMEVRRIGDCSEEAQNIKIADAIDNLRDIVKIDKKFAEIYYEEKVEMACRCRLARPELLESLKKQLKKTCEELYDTKN
jgi:(p)ppGpp synthase/HD superfamily hydrolase